VQHPAACKQEEPGQFNRGAATGPLSNGVVLSGRGGSILHNDVFNHVEKVVADDRHGPRTADLDTARSRL